MLMQPARARLDPDGHQVVDVVIDRGYHPAAIVAQAGLPLRLVFMRQDGDACTERVVFSSPHMDRRLAATGPTTIDLPAQPPGEVRFTCGMGRYRGRIQLIAERAPSIMRRLRNRASRLRTPVGTALVLWISTLPLIAWVAGCLWASGRSPERSRRFHAVRHRDRSRRTRLARRDADPAPLPTETVVPIEFMPGDPGEHEFTCQMGMLRGRIVEAA